MNAQDPLLPSVVLGALVVIVAVVTVVILVGRRIAAARRLAADIRILLDANPGHRLHHPGPPELAMIASAVEALAERRRVAEEHVEAQVASAAERLARDRDRLAWLLAELGVAVVVCNDEGRILLYNAAARAVVADDVALGIGRPVTGVVDPDRLAEARERLRDGAPSVATTTLHRDRLLEVRVAPVRGDADAGFVLLLEDLTALLSAAEAVADRPHLDLGQRAEELRTHVERARRPQEDGNPWGSRPEFYDFDLFDRRLAAGDSQDRPLRELAFTVLDTETTGLHVDEGDEVVSIGAVRVVNGRLVRHESFERLVDPGRSVPAVATAVHGLTRAMLTGQPRLEELLPEFARYAEDTVLVGHNIGFDLQFLRRKEDATGVRLDQPVLDTLLLDVVAHPDHEEHSLEAVSARLGVTVVDRHSALGDAVATAEVLLRLIPLLERLGITTLREALEASQATFQARLDRRMYGG